MNPRTRLILTIVGIVVICVLFFFFFIRPRSANLDKVKQDVVAEQARTSVLQGELARLQELQANAPKLEAELTRLQRFIPSGDHEVPNFIFLVQAAANAAGVEFLQITPALPVPPPEGAPVGQISVSMNSAGSYFSVQDFIRRLYNLNRAVRLDSLNLSPTVLETGEVELTMTGQFRIFFEPPAVPAPPVEEAPPAPEEEG